MGHKKAEGLRYRRPVLDTHLLFGGMDIDIDTARGEVQMERAEGILMLHQKSVIAVLQTPGEKRALHVAPADKKVFKAAVSSGQSGSADKSPDGKVIGVQRHIQHIGRNLASEHLVNHIPEVPASGSGQLLLPLIDEAESDFRVGKGHVLHQLKDVGSLRVGL